MSNQIVSDPDMVYLREQAETLLPDLCDIQEHQVTPDGRGGYTEEWAISYQNVRCRLANAQTEQAEGLDGARSSIDEDWMLTLPYDQAITRDDRIWHNGLLYEVVFVNTTRSYDSARRVRLRRID